MIWDIQCSLNIVCSGKADIERAIEAEPALAGRSWKNVKDCVRNAI
jgi:hypothetical protein